jgi:hypothetical protein
MLYKGSPGGGASLVPAIAARHLFRDFIEKEME